MPPPGEPDTKERALTADNEGDEALLGRYDDHHIARRRDGFQNTRHGLVEATYLDRRQGRLPLIQRQHGIAILLVEPDSAGIGFRGEDSEELARYSSTFTGE